jgi:hypothetical protein
MNNLHITCKNLEQRQDVFDSLDKMGLVPVGSHSDFLQVNAAMKKEERKYMTVVEGDVWPGSEILTYPQFMDKYSMNQLKTKIEEVKAKLGLTQMQLSERIGKNPYYLDTVKHRGVTIERQEELIRELDLVTNGGTVMTERELIASLSERLTSAQSANRELCLKLQLAEKNHRQLEGMYDSNWDKLQEANKLVASLQVYKHQYRDLVATVIVIGIIIILGLAIWSVV